MSTYGFSEKELDGSVLGWTKDGYGYVTCNLCKATVNPNMSSMLAHVDTKHKEPAR